MNLVCEQEAEYPDFLMILNLWKKKSVSAEEAQVLELVRELKEGDRGAFDEIFRIYHRRIFNLAFRMLGDYEEAADQTQEIFVKLFSKINQFQGRSKFYTWFYTLALNSCRNHLVSGKRRNHEPLPEEDLQSGALENGIKDNPETPESQTEKKERSMEIRKVMERLPSSSREVLILRDIQGFSYEEIGDMLELAPGTVKSRISRAREMLRREWISCFGGDNEM